MTTRTKCLNILMLMIGCVALLVATCAPVEGRTRHTSKKPKASAARKKAVPVKPVETASEVNKTEVSPSETESPALEATDDTTIANAAPQGLSPEWEFSVTPYVFLAGLDGTVGVIGESAQVDASFSDIFRNLDFAAMATVEARKGNWMFLGDFMYISLSGQRATPSPLFSDIDVEVKELIIEPAVGYRAVKHERGSIDLLAGVRIWHVESHLTFQPRIRPLVDVEGSKNWADPIVGARGVVNVSPRVFLTGRFDMGGMGVGSDFTGQAFGGVGFQLKPRVALIGGYRYLRVDYVDEGFIFKTAMSGITLGAKFRL